MSYLLNLFILIPFLGFLINICTPKQNEKVISYTAFYTILIHLLVFISFFIYWIKKGFQPINLKEISILKSNEYEFFIDLYFDKITVVYLFVGTFLSLLVTVYSRFYMHKESGYKRFFNTILFFFLGYNIVILSGNFETLFLGWELLGLASFLLIAFYRDRYLPVKNANKVFAIYRIGDVGLILTMWASHLLWHENITFMKLNNEILVHDHLLGHSFIGVFISICIVIAASAKSAQLPFSSWLPRAMEGPTPSSAIFYGSLSVHLGIFLLMRTFPFWENQIVVRVFIVLIGLSTSVIAMFIARVQSSAKSQIAYSSVSQIGLIFIELALGLETLALIHFAGNAFLRTYQLLISPSVVSYLIREQIFNDKQKIKIFDSPNTLINKLKYSIYLLSLKEFNLDSFINLILWSPMRRLGRVLDFLSFKKILILIFPFFFVGYIVMYFNKLLPIDVSVFLPGFYAFIALIMTLKAYSERISPLLSWLMLITNHLWITLAILFNEHFSVIEMSFYLSGILIFGTLGFVALYQLKSKEKKFNLKSYYGHSYEHPLLAFVFLLACLGVMGFPISLTFIGIDLVYSHIHENQIFLAFFVASSFVVSGIACIRLYSRLFLGVHYKTYHEKAYKSS
jgi:NADH-quinone oxidoreductase subunit L